MIDYTNINKSVHLEELFPPGVFDSYTETGQNALEVFGALEYLLNENCNQNTLLSRYTLLQTYQNRAGAFEQYDREGNFFDIFDDFIYFFNKALSPDIIKEFATELNNEEAEIFLKNYIVSHETFGKPEGWTNLIKSMLENVAGKNIPVRSMLYEQGRRDIPEQFKSRLGKSLSSVGKDFIIGNSYYGMPEILDIFVGPILMSTLRQFQDAGWAEDIYPSDKLKQLASFTEPYYLKTRIHFILATEGFKLGVSRLAADRLGTVVKLED